jgi:hypothetical protein
MSKTKFIYIAILMMLPFEGISQEMVNDLQNILIRNVTVIDQTGRTDEVVVNLLIKQNKLNLVTKDKVEMKQADITFDAKNGYVLGQLEVGELAGFIILGEDPRRQHPENCVNEVRQKDRTFYIRLKNTQL